MLDVRRMRVLREVAERGSIAAAAQALSFTPSAVSQQIATLEREAGVALVERGPRSIRLTQAGRALVEHTDGILASLEAAEADIQAIAGVRGGMLRLASFPTAYATIMPAAIGEFRARHPEVELTLTEADPLMSIARLKSGELDLALLYEYDYVPLPEDDSVERFALADDPIRVLLPNGHRHARRRADHLDLALLVPRVRRPQLPGGGLRARYRLRERRPRCLAGSRGGRRRRCARPRPGAREPPPGRLGPAGRPSSPEAPDLHGPSRRRKVAGDRRDAGRAARDSRRSRGARADRGARLGRSPRLDAEEGACPSGGLGPVGRDVSRPVEVVDRAEVGRSSRDAAREAVRAAGDQRLLRALRDRDRIRRGRAGQDDGELVASQPAGNVACADGRAQRIPHRFERLVAGGVAAEIVNALEPVEIDDEQREL